VPGSVFPVYHVLADMAECRSAQMRVLETTDPLRIQGLALSMTAGIRLLFANLTDAPQTVELPAEVERAEARRIRIMDEANVLPAANSPEKFRVARGDDLPPGKLHLPPRAVVRLDAGDQETTR
jgi:hypothetical protein